ncbi:long-chain fatty acid-CoA ligase, partial [Spiromyces aspiralis]
YVALERLESIYKTSLYVDNICVFANSLLTQPVAVVCPNRKAVERWAEDNGVSADGVFASNEQVERLKHEIMRSFDQIAKNNGLARFETMYDIVLDEDEWTPENGCLTAANKLRRKDIESRHQDIINDIYTRASDNNQR